MSLGHLEREIQTACIDAIYHRSAAKRTAYLLTEIR